MLLSCKSLEDEANSGQARQEAANSADEQANGAQPGNDLTLKVERQVFFCRLFMCCICFSGGSFAGFWVFLKNTFNYRILVLIPLSSGKHLCGLNFY